MPSRVISTRALLMLCLGLASVSAQAEIYKWTDEQGKVHYSQTPPMDTKTKAEDIGDLIGMAAGTGSASKETDTTTPTSDEDEMAKAKQDGVANTEKHLKFCDQQKAALKQLLANPVIKWKTAEVEKILTADERQAKITEFEQNIKEMCNKEVLEGKAEVSSR